MARLTEFEGKTFLSRNKILIPNGRLVHSEYEAALAVKEIGLPVVVKAQVLWSGRFKKGAIKIVSNENELEDAIKNIFLIDKSISKDKGVLIEKKYNYKQEFYLSIASDEKTLSPVILFSAKGGIDVEENSIDIRQSPIDILRGPTDKDLQILLDGVKEASKISDLLKKVYKIYRSLDCKLIEINPLILTSDGPMALDAKINIDEDALFRHPEFNMVATEENLNREPTPLEISASNIDKNDHRGTAHIVELDYGLSKKGIRVALDCVGTGVSLAILDELSELGYLPANFADTSGNPPASKLYKAIRLIFTLKEIEGFIFASCVSSQQLDNTARGIIKALKDIYPETNGKPDIPCLFMFRGAWDEDAIKLFEEHGISGSENVVVLGRDCTEYDAAREFDKLYKSGKSLSRC